MASWSFAASSAAVHLPQMLFQVASNVPCVPVQASAPTLGFRLGIESAELLTADLLTYIYIYTYIFYFQVPNFSPIAKSTYLLL